MAQLQRIVEDLDPTRRDERIKKTAKQMAAMKHTYASTDAQVKKTAERLERQITEAAAESDRKECQRKFTNLIPAVQAPAVQAQKRPSRPSSTLPPR